MDALGNRRVGFAILKFGESRVTLHQYAHVIIVQCLSTGLYF